VNTSSSSLTNARAGSENIDPIDGSDSGSDDGGRGRPEGAFRPKPVLRPRQQVEKQLKDAILSGAIAQGERLPSETKLASELSVSRATVREALRALAESGLITKQAGATGGSFVEYVDHKALATVLSDRLQSTLQLGSITFQEVSAFRDLLEVPSARLAATNRTAAQLEALRAIVDEEKQATVDDPRVPELNAQFHVALAEASGNRMLTATVTAMHAATHPLGYIETSPDLGRQSVKHHIAIVSAVRDRDADAAVSAMRTHLRYLEEHAATREA
jgi:GntR family transcriptional repressor for pyruvate dehydrogenase complex